MAEALSNEEIISFLKQNYQSAGFIDGLKIKYRSLICPFTDLIPLVQPGHVVGDVGCGSGQFLLLLNHFAQPAKVYGIEVSRRLIDNANKLFHKMPEDKYGFDIFDGIHFPENLRQMDIIFLVDVLHHVPSKNLEAFMGNLITVMKPGARLVLKDIDRSNPLVYFNKLHDMIFAGEIGNEISRDDASLLLKNNGLAIIEESKRTMYVYPHYTIIAKK
ncbi:MAG: class I SAM-dependent methyltransferase [Ferruginibacter sp.]